MPINKAMLESIAHLARLDIKQTPHFAEEISKIIDMVDGINQIDTTGIEPMAHPNHAVQRLREDHVTETNQREHFQTIAPQAEDGLYLVPKVIGE